MATGLPPCALRETPYPAGYLPISDYGIIGNLRTAALDAANLRIPLVEFLPFDDERVAGTIDRTIEHLTKNGLVYRYLTRRRPPPAARGPSASAPSGWWTCWPYRGG